MEQQMNLTQMKYNICYNNMWIREVAFSCVKIVFHEPLGGDIGAELIGLIQKANEDATNKWDIIQYLKEKKIPYDLKFRYLKNLSLRDNLYNWKIAKAAAVLHKYQQNSYTNISYLNHNLFFSMDKLSKEQQEKFISMVEEARQRNFGGFVDLVEYVSNETDSDIRMVYFWDNAFSPVKNLMMLRTIHKFNRQAKKEKKLIRL